jgi:AcrR family transcriptional regulator
MTDLMDTPSAGRSRVNRGSEQVRGRLIESAIAEFAAHGFEGSSGRRIAAEAGAHQSQINYHFSSKDELWKASLERLLAELDTALAGNLTSLDESDTRAVFSATVRGLVQFAARRPELNRIMMHEGAAPGERLRWLVDTHMRGRHAGLMTAWDALTASGDAAAVDRDVIYHSLVGAASLLYANAPEAVLLGIKPAGRDMIDRHAASVVAMFLKPLNH